EELRAFLPVVIGSGVGATDDHHDVVVVDDALVADRRLEQVTVFLDPRLQVNRGGQRHGSSPSGGQGGDALELDGDRRRQRVDAQGGAARGGVDVGEILRPHRVVAGEVARHVGEVDGDVHQVLPARAAGLEHCAHVREHGGGLGTYVVGDQPALGVMHVAGDG